MNIKRIALLTLAMSGLFNTMNAVKFPKVKITIRNHIGAPISYIIKKVDAKSGESIRKGTIKQDGSEELYLIQDRTKKQFPILQIFDEKGILIPPTHPRGGGQSGYIPSGNTQSVIVKIHPMMSYDT